LVILAAVAALGWLVLGRANELSAFRLSPAGARLVRGRAPAGLLHDFDDVARRTGVGDVTVRVVTEGGVPRLIVPAGLMESVAQPLRNAVGRYDVVHFRTGRRAR